MFWRKSQRDADREALMEAMRLVVGAVEKHLEAIKEQNALMAGYFEFLQADGAPESRVMRDEDEFQLEVERMKRARVWQGEES